MAETSPNETIKQKYSELIIQEVVKRLTGGDGGRTLGEEFTSEGRYRVVTTMWTKMMNLGSDIEPGVLTVEVFFQVNDDGKPNYDANTATLGEVLLVSVKDE